MIAPALRIPLETQTLYAELLEHLLALAAERSVGHLRGTFVTKQVTGRPDYKINRNKFHAENGGWMSSDDDRFFYDFKPSAKEEANGPAKPVCAVVQPQAKQ